MTKLSLGLLALTLAAAASVPAAAQETETVPLEKILASPLGFKGITVSFVIQFHKLGNLDGPVYTKFEKDWYQNFSAWSDSARLWSRDDYRNDYAFFFVKRMSQGAQLMTQAPQFSRWLVTGEVSEVFLDRAWIEITSFQRLEKSMDWESVRWLNQGMTAEANGDYRTAAVAFHYADRPSLPTDVRLMSMEREAEALHRSGDSMAAVNRLQHALEISDKAPEIERRIVDYRASMGLDAEGNPLPVAPLETGSVTPNPNTGTPIVEPNSGSNSGTNSGTVNTGTTPVNQGENRPMEKVTIDLVPPNTNTPVKQASAR